MVPEGMLLMWLVGGRCLECMTVVMVVGYVCLLLEPECWTKSNRLKIWGLDKSANDHAE